MKRTILCLGLIFCCLSTAISGETIVSQELLSYKRLFIKASLSDKTSLLRDAAGKTSVDMGSLFIDALQFAIESRPVLGGDPELIQLTVQGLSFVNTYNPQEHLPLLWQVFEVFPEVQVRVLVMESLGAIAAAASSGTDEIVSRLNTFLLEQASPGRADDSVVLAVVNTLGKFNDSTSFIPLFRVVSGNRSSSVRDAAAAVLNTITENYAKNIISLIRTESLPGKLAAFRLSEKNTAISDILKGEIAETALKTAIDISETSQEGEQRKMLRHLRREAVLDITEVRWSRASPQVIRYIYMTQTDYKNNLVDADALIEVIDCLSVMGTQEAAQTLSIYLGLLNSDTEETGSYNETVVLAVINALGALGDKIAFDYLLYVSYLSYSETVIAASRDAMGRLTW
ncbi:MAG: hypothetical protein LBU99_07280 [Spirochaetaceae bacterium]|jgi:HEAT repeat protein|nr:hypothetical protein [Spirochaetaceae bacterium]